MMRGAILTILITFLSSAVLAQAGIDHEKLSKELDRFELELLFLYIKDNVELTKHTLTNPDENQRVNGGFTLLLSLKNNDWNAADLSSVRDKLQNEYSWKKTTENVKKWLEPLREESKDIDDFERLKGILIKYIHQDGRKNPKYKPLYNHINEHNPGKLDELINRLLSRVTVESDTRESDSEVKREEVGESTNAEIKDVIKKLQEHNDSLKEANRSLKKRSGGLSYLMSGLIAFAALVLGFLIRGFGSKKTESRSRKSGGDSKQNNEETWGQATRNADKHNSEIKKLRDKIDYLENENKELKEQKESIMTKKIPLEVELGTQSAQTIEAQVEAQPKVVYLSSPSDDGTFSRTYETYTIGNKSYFEFILTSENTADFKFIDDTSIQKKAIDTFGERIKEIADEANWIDAQSKCIKMEAFGKAEKDGETWKVSKKAKVRYI